MAQAQLLSQNKTVAELTIDAHTTITSIQKHTQKLLTSILQRRDRDSGFR